MEHWNPSVTVAAVIERDGRFLLVEEHTADGLRLNQPAGHLEANETLLDAVVREALEESAYQFVPQSLLGVYMVAGRSSRTGLQTCYMRFAFAGALGKHFSDRALDEGIVRTVWMTPDEIRASRDRHRSTLVERCVDDWLAGRRLPLDALYADPSVSGEQR